MHSDCGQDRSNLDTSYMNNKHGNAGAAKGEKPQVAATSESSSGEGVLKLERIYHPMYNRPCTSWLISTYMRKPTHQPPK